MAHQLAMATDVTPWDALLGEVRRTAGEVAWLDWKVGTAPDDESLLTGGTHHEWLKMRERQRLWLGRVSKMAIDAGVAAMLVQRERVAGEEVARVLNRTLDALVEAGLGENLETLARSTMRRELLALDAGTAAPGGLDGDLGRKTGDEAWGS